VSDPSHPVLLAIETSQRRGGVALRTADGSLLSEALLAGRRHDDDLMPAISRVFERAGLLPAALEAVAVSIGPGGFSGLRIAVSTAKMLAETCAAALIGVPSADVAVAAGPPVPGRVLVALACKRGSFWATWYEAGVPAGNPGLAETGDVDVGSLQALVGDEHLPPELVAACEAAGVAIRPLEPTAEALARIAGTWLSSERTTPAAALLPLYPRPPEAVSLWDERERTARD
jgi:tRNA threonylcarbamoyladenosine biosynthesis protein TsaB